MAISLSELTGASTSGNVLNEVNSYADFLDSVPRLVNKADPSGDTDAVQTTATNQPKALPLIKDANGDLGGYLYIPNASGNYAEGPSVTIGSNETWEAEVDMVITQWGNYITPFGGGDWPSGFGILFYFDGDVRSCSKGVDGFPTPSGVTLGTAFNAKFGYDGTIQYVKINDSIVWSNGTLPDQSGSITHPIRFSAHDNLTHQGNYAINRAKLTVGGSVVFECDFRNPRIPHGSREFTCETGQVVTVNTSGNDPATIIKKPVLRFPNQSDGSTTIGLDGLFSQEFNGGYMFASLSVLGDGGAGYGYVFATNKTGGNSSTNGGVTFIYKHFTDNNLGAYRGALLRHFDLFDDSNGDILYEHKATNSSSLSKVNNADEVALSNTYVIESDEFKIGKAPTTNNHAAFDLEYLALFPASLSDSQADQIRNFINNRNSVFLRHDTDGYFFFDGAATYDGQVLSSSTPWNGRIVGSDNGDSDFYINQNTLDDRPTTDGYKITFADNTDHFDIPSTTQAGWQVVGTSLGTFAYKVNANAVTELNLLGNLGNTAHRKAGDLYGIILLPESATSRDIEEARKLLIDRGASDGTTSGSIFTNWIGRSDIVEFKAVNMSSVTFLDSAFNGCSGLISFPSLDLSNGTSFNSTWINNTSLRTFATTLMPKGNSFTSAWQNTSSLTTFPADAKLGTEAASVNFTSAWQQSGLTSFPALDLSNGSNFTNAWFIAASMTEFSEGAKLGTNKTNVSFQNAFRTTGLTSFRIPLPTGTNFAASWRDSASLALFSSDLSSATDLNQAFRGCLSLTDLTLTGTSSVASFEQAFLNCNSLTSFPSIDISSSRIFLQTWFGCSSLVDFPENFFANWNPSSITTGVFNLAWDGCTSLTAQSVENILTSIDTSGKYATSTGLSGGTALGDATIDIDYNASTGSLTAATLTAIETLNGRGWSVNINNEIIVPNILQLQPAAAYSLRSFDADADPNVVNVRRSSDSALRDFTASEVSDGTLTDWVNTNVDLVTPTLNNGGFEDGLTGWSSSTAIVDTSVAYSGSNSARLDIVSGGYQEIARQNILEIGKEYKVTFWAKVSDSSKDTRVDFGSGNLNAVSFDSTNWEYKEVTGVASGSSSFRFARSSSGDYSVNFDNITLTQLTADGHVTTWYDQGGTNHATQTTVSAQPKIVENGLLITENGEAALNFPTEVSNLSLDHSDLYGQATLDSYYVTSTSDTTYSYPALVNSSSNYGMVSQPLDGGSPTSLFYGSPTYYANSIQLTSPTRDSIYQATSGGQKLVAHIGADTTNEKWSEHDMNFGNLSNNVSFGYTGKLQEMLFFNTDQSANRTGIETNINDHFNIYS